MKTFITLTLMVSSISVFAEVFQVICANASATGMDSPGKSISQILNMQLNNLAPNVKSVSQPTITTINNSQTACVTVQIGN